MKRVVSDVVGRCFHCGLASDATVRLILEALCVRCAGDSAFGRNDFTLFRYLTAYERIGRHDDQRIYFDSDLWARVGPADVGRLTLNPALVRRPVRLWNEVRRFLDLGEQVERGDMPARGWLVLVRNEPGGPVMNDTMWSRPLHLTFPTRECACADRAQLYPTAARHQDRADGSNLEMCFACGRLWTVRNGIAVPESA